MPISRLKMHSARLALFLLCCSTSDLPAQSQKPARGPIAEKLTYRIEWRMVTAATANLQFQRTANNNWQIDLDLESTGLVNRLYRVLDKYRVVAGDRLCASTVDLDAQEGKRHMLTHVAFDNLRHKLDYTERDLLKNTAKQKTLDIPACTYEVTGALAALGQSDLPPGKSTALAVTDGKKVVSAKIESQARENVSVDGKAYRTVRYEVFLFDNVLYKRKGRLFLWLTDDQDKTPVQLQIQLGFPIGAISLELEKLQKL